MQQGKKKLPRWTYIPYLRVQVLVVLVAIGRILSPSSHWLIIRVHFPVHDNMWARGSIITHVKMDPTQL